MLPSELSPSSAPPMRSVKTDFRVVPMDGVRDTLHRGLRLVTFYSLPTAVAFIVLSQTHHRHRLSARRLQRKGNTVATAEALKYYSLGTAVLFGSQSRGADLYSLKLARFAVMSTVLTVTGSVLVNLFLHPGFPDLGSVDEHRRGDKLSVSGRGVSRRWRNTALFRKHFQQGFCACWSRRWRWAQCCGF